MIYQRASDLLSKALNHEMSIKSLTLGPDTKDLEPSQRKQLHGLLCRVLEYRQPLTEIIANAKLLELERKLSMSLALVLVYELLFGKGTIKHNKKHKNHVGELVIKHKTRLNAELVKLKVKRRVKDNKDLVPSTIRELLDAASGLPKYVRVNRNSTDLEAVIKQLQSEGWKLVENVAEITADSLNKKAKKIYAVDRHVSDLLIVPAKTDLHLHQLYLSHSIILQDKASCFPAMVLSSPKGSVAIDACAAPGNKTTHLSGLMENTGTIYAFDMDPKRCKTLQRRVNETQSTNVEVACQSFLEVDPLSLKYSKVSHFLLDPSCSGSGIVSRLDALVDDQEMEDNTDNTADRLASLAEFQKSIITHAMKFPAAKKIVYSTCSIHGEENEQVVHSILSTHPEWELENVMPSWHRRGVSSDNGLSADLALKVVRCLPEDGTNGFFVSCFSRRK